MEAYDYPIHATMYHPEYQAAWGDYENRDNAHEIGFRISLLLNREARMNTNTVSEGPMKDLVRVMDVHLTNEPNLFPMSADFVAFGFNSADLDNSAIKEAILG